MSLEMLTNEVVRMRIELDRLQKTVGDLRSSPRKSSEDFIVNIGDYTPDRSFEDGSEYTENYWMPEEQQKPDHAESSDVRPGKKKKKPWVIIRKNKK